MHQGFQARQGAPLLFDEMPDEGEAEVGTGPHQTHERLSSHRTHGHIRERLRRRYPTGVLAKEQFTEKCRPT